MKHLIEQKIVEMLSESVTHPYHAHVTSVANYGTGKEDNLVTGFGKTKQESKHAANMSGKIYHDPDYDHDYDDYKDKKDYSKHDVRFRVSEKAHKHLEDQGHDMHSSYRDGYEHTYPDDHEHLHFDWKKKTISHKSEVKHK